MNCLGEGLGFIAAGFGVVLVGVLCVGLFRVLMFVLLVLGFARVCWLWMFCVGWCNIAYCGWGGRAAVLGEFSYRFWLIRLPGVWDLFLCNFVVWFDFRIWGGVVCFDCGDLDGGVVWLVCICGFY